MAKPLGSPADKTRASSTFERFACVLLCWLLARQLGLLDLLPFARGDLSLLLGFVALILALVFRRLLPLLKGVATALFVLWLAVVFTPLPARLMQPLKLDQPPQEADAVVVLQAGIQKDNDFTASTLERTLHALELIHEGYAPNLVLTEDGRLEGSHQDAAAKLMKNIGVMAPIFAVGPVENTHDEAVKVEELMKQNRWQKILLVTSPMHSTRGTLLFRKLGVQVISSPCRETQFDFENLEVGDIDGRMQAFSAAMREIVGLFIYKRRGWV